MMLWPAPIAPTSRIGAAAAGLRVWAGRSIPCAPCRDRAAQPGGGATGHRRSRSKGPHGRQAGPGSRPLRLRRFRPAAARRPEAQGHCPRAIPGSSTALRSAWPMRYRNAGS